MTKMPFSEITNPSRASLSTHRASLSCFSEITNLSPVLLSQPIVRKNHEPNLSRACLNPSWFLSRASLSTLLRNHEPSCFSLSKITNPSLNRLLLPTQQHSANSASWSWAYLIKKGEFSISNNTLLTSLFAGFLFPNFYLQELNNWPHCFYTSITDLTARIMGIKKWVSDTSLLTLTFKKIYMWE